MPLNNRGGDNSRGECAPAKKSFKPLLGISHEQLVFNMFNMHTIACNTCTQLLVIHAHNSQLPENLVFDLLFQMKRFLGELEVEREAAVGKGGRRRIAEPGEENQENLGHKKTMTQQNQVRKTKKTWDIKKQKHSRTR